MLLEYFETVGQVKPNLRDTDLIKRTSICVVQSTSGAVGGNARSTPRGVKIARAGMYKGAGSEKAEGERLEAWS